MVAKTYINFDKPAGVNALEEVVPARVTEAEFLQCKTNGLRSRRNSLQDPNIEMLVLQQGLLRSISSCSAVSI